MSTYRWLGKVPEGLVTARYKKDMKLKENEGAIRIKFRFETVYCVMGLGGLVMKDGKECRVITACLNNGGFVMGLPDITAADHTELAAEWRGMMSERVSNN